MRISKEDRGLDESPSFIKVQTGHGLTSIVTTFQMLVLFFTLFIALGLIACNPSDEAAKQGTEVAQSCSEAELIAQCPPNTAPDLEINAEAACSLSGSFDASQDLDTLEGGGSIDTACVGSGSCRVACRLVIPCEHGVERISPSDGIICAAPPEGCGNGSCDSGETPSTCPSDCGMECTPGVSRCNGEQIETCSMRGVWEPPRGCTGEAICLSTESDALCRQPSCGDGIIDIGEECDPSADSDVACDMNCTRPRCGNGVRGLDANGQEEACDDGNENNNDNCTNACELARCGDGYVQEGESCDDGNQEDNDLCDTMCRLATPCGNGTVDSGEECDDGNLENEDACLNTCVMNSCGDGYLYEGVEACDDGNQRDDDQCTNTCLLARCGDGILQVGIEECDDGNQRDDDQCTNACTIPRCGDGVTQAGEECDDGNMNDEDGCLSSCVLATCGDGFLYSAEEQCDDENRDDADACLSTCESATCGDGVRRGDLAIGDEDFEYCDDGNQGEFDGCNSLCVQTELEPNDTGGTSDVNTILYDQIVGVLEGATSEFSPGIDTFRFEVDCGVGQGNCPPGGEVTWNFSITSPTEVCMTSIREPGCFGTNCRVCTERGFQVIPACNGSCPTDNHATVTWGRLGRVGTWSVTADVGGVWEFQLQNLHTEAFSYTLRVSRAE